MYSPASQKLAVGSTVNENVDKAIVKTTKAITLFKKRKNYIYSYIKITTRTIMKVKNSIIY